MQNDILVVTPVFNDWDCLVRLLEELDQTLFNADVVADVLAVDDGSSQSWSRIKNRPTKFVHIKKVNILHLTRNLGHQRAVAIGLAYANANYAYQQIIVMDSDGEDRTTDVKNLVDEQRLHPHELIFGQRVARSESLVFRAFYLVYKILFRWLTGATISFGNFSSIPAELLGRVVHLSEIWNHYAAGIVHSKITWRVIPTPRGTRYSGKSHMSFIFLVLHGLSAISVFLDVISVRLIVFSFVIIFAEGIGVAFLLWLNFLTKWVIPGWAITGTFGLVIITVQMLIFLGILSLSVLNNRGMRLLIPARDFLDFVSTIEKM